jgi:ArsR family transcriptional regulator
VTIHQVLHFLDRPDLAIAEAARVLRPGGRLVIVDFAPHALEHLRDEHAHVRLGFSHQLVSEWLNRFGLDVEQVVDLSPGREGALTVTVWLARDRRLLIAGARAAQTESV